MADINIKLAGIAKLNSIRMFNNTSEDIMNLTRHSESDFLINKQVQYEGKRILFTMKNSTPTNTNIDFSTENEYEYDSTLVQVTGGATSLVKSVFPLVPDNEWSMDSSSNVITDSRGSSNGVATMYGTGVDSYQVSKPRLKVNGAVNMNWSTGLYIDCWIYIYSYHSSENSVIFSLFNTSNEGIRLRITDAGLLNVYFYDGTNTWEFTTNDSLSLETWYHVAFNPYNVVPTFRLYLNSVLMTGNVSGTITPAFNFRYLFGYIFHFGPFDGRIKNSTYASVTDVLTIAEFRYNNGIPTNGKIPVLLFTAQNNWRMDGTSGDTLIDTALANDITHPLISNIRNSDGVIGYCLDNRTTKIDITLPVLGYVYVFTSPGITFAFWLRFTDILSTHVIFVAHDASDVEQLSIFTDPNGLLVFRIGTGSFIESTNAINDGNWHYITAIIVTDFSNNRGYMANSELYIDSVIMPDINKTDIGEYANDLNKLYLINSSPIAIDEFIIHHMPMEDYHVDFKYNGGVGTQVATIQFTPTGDWPMKENLLDISGIEKNMSLVDSISPIYVSNAVDLGSNESMLLSTNNICIISNQSDLTIDGWIYIDTLDPDNYIFRKSFTTNEEVYKGYYLKVNVFGQLELKIWSSDTTFQEIIYRTSLVSGTWYHIMYIHKLWEIYVNGDRASEIVIDDQVLGVYDINEGSFTFGPFKGKLDEFLAYYKTGNETYLDLRYNNGIKTSALSTTFTEIPSLKWAYEDNLTPTGSLASSVGDLVGTGVTYVTGKYGNVAKSSAYMIKEAVGYINIYQETAWTVEAWYFGAGSINTILWIDVDAAYNIGPQDLLIEIQADTLRLSLAGRLVFSTGSFPNNDSIWHHVLVSYDGSNNTNGYYLYHDGIRKYLDSNHVNLVIYSLSTTYPRPNSQEKIQTRSFTTRLTDEVTLYMGKTLGLLSAVDRYTNNSDNPISTPIFHYTFDGTIDDTGSLDNNLYIAEAATFGTDYIDLGSMLSRLDFDTSAGLFDQDDPYSFETKFKMSSTQFGTILSKMDKDRIKGYRIYVGPTGKIYFEIRSAGGSHVFNTTSTGFNDDTFKTLIVTYDGDPTIASATKIYVDSPIAEGIAGVVTATPESSTSISSENFMMGRMMSGFVGDTRLYNKELDGTEVTNRYSDNFGQTYPLNVPKTIIVNDGVVPRVVFYNMTDIGFTEGGTGTIGYLFLVGTTYYKWVSGAWTSVSVGTIGNTSAELAAADFVTLGGLYLNANSLIFKIIVSLSTAGATVTPTLDTITITYNGFIQCTPAQVEEEMVDDIGLISSIKNISGADIDNLIVYTFTY